MPIFKPDLTVSIGASSVVPTSPLVFSNAGGVTFGLSGSTITASAPAAAGALTNIKLSADTLSALRSDVTFSNANGVSFGLETNGVITAMVRTNYQAAGAYLTTAMASDRGSDFVQATAGFNGTNVSGTIASNALSVSVKAQSNQTVGLYASSNTYLTSSGTVDARSLSFRGDKSITVGVSAGEVLFSVGAYLTTADLSQNSSNYAGINGAITGGSITVNTSGVSVNLPAYLTTALGVGMTDSGRTFGTTGLATGRVFLVAAAGQAFSQSINGGDATISMFPQQVFVTNLGNTAGTTGQRAGSAALVGSQNITLSVGTGTSNVNGISWSNQSITILGPDLTPYLTTAALSGDTSKYVAAWELDGANTAGTTSSAQGTKLYLSAGNSLTFSGNSNTIVLSIGPYITTAMLSNRGSDFVAATAAFNGTNASGTIASNAISVSVAGPVTDSYDFQPFMLDENTATSTGSLSNLCLQPFTLANYLSFGQVNMIGSASVAPTSASNNWSVRLTNSSQGLIYSAVYTVTNSNFVDLFLFSRGSGVFSSELETFASTRNTFVTYYLATHSGRVTLTNTAGGNISLTQQFSMSISYPMITSTTQTSVSTNSTYTSWGTGYTTWTSTASNSTSNTYSTSAAQALALASTYPATTAWSSYKLVPFNFGSSLTPGEYWLGVVRYSSTSSSSNSGSSVTGAAGTGASYSATYNASQLTQTAALTFGGNTYTVASSLGWLGFASQATMAAEAGLGTFSQTWMGSATYLNNLANPNGAVAFTQINTGVSFFRSWIQFASNRI